MTRRGSMRKAVRSAKLTKRVVETAEPAADRYIIWDTVLEAFGVQVFSTGRKTFLANVWVRGPMKQRRVAIGAFGTFTVEEARERARELLQQGRAGIDPKAEAERRRAAAITLREVWAITLERSDWKPKTRLDHGMRWRVHIEPKLGGKELSSIERRDIVNLHQSLKATPTTANRVVQLVRTLIARAIEWGLYDGKNPASGVTLNREQGRETFLSLAQIEALFAALDEFAAVHQQFREAVDSETATGREARGMPPPIVALFRLLVYTGARVGEWVGCRWEWVDIDRGVVELPDSKTGKKSIWLNQEAMDILTALYAVRNRNTPWVIAGRLPGARLNTAHPAWRRLRKRAAELLVEGERERRKQEGRDPKGPLPPPLVKAAAELAAARIHDLRHTYASLGIGEGLSLSVIGKTMGHARSSTTDRYAHLADQAARQAAGVIGKKIGRAKAGKKGEG
ncbi:tyrosine-type recombinase/integrase [bacterium]|nr:tyrosine-type recombinase/integrase [bacterium]